MLIVFKDRTQFLLLPAIGFVRQRDGYCFTVGFLFYGITIRVAKFVIARDD